jgi:hypothetical protein
MGQDAIVEAVSQHLSLPTHLVQAAQDHDNKQHAKENKNVEAYAKLSGRDWTYYVQRITTTVGRPPEGIIPPEASPQPSTASVGGTSLPAPPTEPGRVHLDFGPNKLVSRQHAWIYFEKEKQIWEMLVNGRNGAKVDGITIPRGKRSILVSGNVIEIGGVEMMFVLPENDSEMKIDPRYLRRAKLIEPGSRDDTLPDQNNSGGFDGQSDQKSRGTNPHGPLPIAPAPPDYRRPNTPVGKQRGGRSGAFTHSPYATSDGALMDQVDFSLTENDNIKPNLTYLQLITQAMMSAPNEKITLNGIYEWIKANFSYFRRLPEKGWTVS